MLTRQEIQNMRNLLLKAFSLLCLNETDLVDLGDNEVLEYDNNVRSHERKLHEVCINHRFAHYLEVLLPKYYQNDYKVDIEYNRYYKNKKYINIAGDRKAVRPDIIIHTRAVRLEYPQHLLIIEAKKDEDSPEDVEIVKSFIEDSRYQYIFGLTVRYNDFNPVQATLFYKDKNETILNEKIVYSLNF